MSILSNLYPPIISTYMSAFIRTQSCKIYFSLSSLNKASDIKNIQVTVRYQSNNISALDSDKYFSEIKICSLNVDNSETNRYYITLLPDDLETGVFETNQFYQVQLRFTDKDASAVPINGKIENWLIENKEYFSEWSTVCLIRGIDKPILNVNNFISNEGLSKDLSWNETTSDRWKAVSYPIKFEANEKVTINIKKLSDNETINYNVFLMKDTTMNSSSIVKSLGQVTSTTITITAAQAEQAKYIQIRSTSQIRTKGSFNLTIYEENIYRTDLLTVAAQLQYEDSSETEKIKSYELKLYNEEKEKLIEESGIQYTASSFNFNQINYTFRTELQNNTNYVLALKYTTYNNYLEELEYSLKTNITDNSFTFDTILTGESNEELGVNTLTFSIQNINTNFSGNFLIKRSSSEDNFQYWDTIYYLHIPAYNAHNIQFLWDDLTPKMGIWYKYAVQYIDLENNKSKLIKEYNDTPFVLFSEESFLVEDNKLLTLRYDTQISSIKVNNADNIVQTLGSQYPFARRNGNIDYRQFPLSGTITLLSDEGELFTKKKELLKNDYQNEEYEKYINDNRITLTMNDVILEREFRDLVINFLKDGKVKLFRSLQEGNILVKLTDINLTPNLTLGRRIYNFSATATEIGKDSVDNYFKYDISSKVLKKPIYQIYLRVKNYDKNTDTVTIKSSQVINSEEAIILNRRVIGYEDIEGDEMNW